MISKKLIQTVPEAKKHIAYSVLHQLLALFANIFIMWTLGGILEALFTCVLADNIGQSYLFSTGNREKLYFAQLKLANIHVDLISMAGAIFVKFICSMMASHESHNASRMVKFTLRKKIYNKLLRLGNNYSAKVSTAEVLQVSVEGVDQLENYFGNYLPQFFYAMIAPIMLFITVSVFNMKTAVILLICVPLIPISIIAVQKFAKKLLAKYWGEYTGLGDSFLENLQGLNTLKIYSADEMKHREMNEQAESFRKITMRVLTMQLNSISVMDIMAYGGTALGIIIAIGEYNNRNITLGGVFVIILLCSDFFLPMRLLGSYFHVAMNGMAASKKIFAILELEETYEGSTEITSYEIKGNQLSYTYNKLCENNNKPDKENLIYALEKASFEFTESGIYGLVGASGCGKSTLAGILSGNLKGYTGSVTIGGVELSEVAESSIHKGVTVVGLGAYLFKGSLRENLLMGDPNATDDELWAVLAKVNLKEYFKGQDGLDTEIKERGSNFSGGQCQRIALGRALLHNTEVYIFDEATSNIDVESEEQIMAVIRDLGKSKIVILISHRLANVVEAKKIWALDKGAIVEEGSHTQLLMGTSLTAKVENKAGTYKELWNTQQSLENFGVKPSYEAVKGGRHE